MHLLPIALVAALAATAFDPAVHRNEVEAWRAARIARLVSPDNWLSLVGLHWLEDGTHAIGSGADNAIVLAAGPARLGTVTVAGGKVDLALADGVDARIEGKDLAEGARAATLLADTSGTPTLVRFGNASFFLIERSGRFALRVRDNDAKTRAEFAGLDHFPIDAGWRYDARFERHAEGKTIPIASVTGSLDDMPNPGAVVFERDGKTHRIEAVDEGDGQLFLIFADRTSGKTTYGAGRFLYAAPPAEGSDVVVLDFNKAYNPPCVFTPFATCPLAPPENRLDVAVMAGEKKYAKEAH